MRLRTPGSVVAGILLLMLAQGALGQYESTDRSPVGIGFSSIFPSDSRVSDVTSTLIGAVVDVHLRYDDIGRPQVLGTLGWFGKSRLPARATCIPLRLSYLKRLDEEKEYGWYVGASVNAYYVTYEGFDYSIYTREREFVNERGSRMGFGVCGGREFGGGWYAEVRYDNISGLPLPTGHSVGFGGLSLTVGSRVAF